MLSRLVRRVSTRGGLLWTFPARGQRSPLVPTAHHLVRSEKVPTHGAGITTASGLCRTFHASPVCQAVRRRRRGSAAPSASTTDEDEDSIMTHQNLKRLTDPALFEQEATNLIDTIYNALYPLKEINDPFFLTRDRDPEIGNGEYILLDLGPLHGQYTIQIDPESALVVFQSPTSGLHQYFKSVQDGEWRSTQDGHIFQGLLVRDLIRQVQGVPKL